MNKKLAKFLETSRIKWLWTVKVEILIAILSIIAFWKVGVVFRSGDNTSGALDPSYLQFPVLGMVISCLGLLFVWAVINICFKALDSYYDGDDEKDHSVEEDKKVTFNRDWRGASPATRLWIFFLVVIGLFLGFVLSAIAFA